MKHVIAINGASSAGCTSLVDRLSVRTADAVRAFHIDDFVRCLPDATWERCSGSDAGWAEIGMLFNQHLFDECPEGGVVLADCFLGLGHAREHLFERFGCDNVTYVQLYCELDELERREALRGDRKRGLARSQFEVIYSFTDFDVRIDSTRSSVAECADALLGVLPGSLTDRIDVRAGR